MTFYTFTDSGDVMKHTEFTLLPDRYIRIKGQEPTPIEDYGNYLLTPETLTDSQAWDRFISLID